MCVLTDFIETLDLNVREEQVVCLNQYYAIDFTRAGANPEHGNFYRIAAIDRYTAAQKIHKIIPETERSNCHWSLYEHRGALLVYVGDLSDLIF